ncbi:hypothetical protein CHUAL_012542 [Chamberlinius hualienensis]
MADLCRGGRGRDVESSFFSRWREQLHGAHFSDDNMESATLNEDFDPFLTGGEPDFIDDSVNASLTAPPENLWYHGRLDRQLSEQRLLMHGLLGGYLVRESDRRPGSYVLSFLGNTGINHFRITAVCGDYYIGGRQFDSLADLVGYYTSWSDLLKKERLVHPVSPPEPVIHKRRVVAILPYTKMPETDELSFQKGDIFIVHNDMGDGWLWVTQHRTGLSGLIFQELVEELDESIDPNEIYPWFHSSINKTEAVEKLVKAGTGSFLVRPSDNSPGDYSLFFHIRNTIQRFRIEKKGNRYFMGGRSFDSLEAVINRYKTEQIVEGYTLGLPVMKASRFTVELKNISETDGSTSSHMSQKKTEDIYQTLRESRETGLQRRKNLGIKMKGYLYKKSQHTKKWKNIYCVLQIVGAEHHLLFYDNPKRTKPKGLIDLSYTSLYVVHDSFFERPNCFQLVEKALPCLSTVYYLCASTPDLAQEWIQAIRPYCSQQMLKKAVNSGLKELRSLHITIFDAHRVPIKFLPHPYCIISLGEVKVCRTRVREAPDPVWNEEFFLDDIPLDVNSCTVTVYNRGKRYRDTEMAEVTIDLSSLTHGNENEDWYHLSGIIPPLREDWGSIRVRIRYLHEVIMPLEEYSSLRELIIDRHLEALIGLADVCHHDRVPLATTLLRVFRFSKSEMDLLQTMNDMEILKEDDTSTLFRAASLTTTLMDQYMKSVCSGFLQEAIQETLFKIMESRQSCELNPTKLDHPADAMCNADYLLSVLDEIVDSIFMSADKCPRTLRYLFGCLQRSVSSKWPHDPLVRTRVVSGFIFLRLICPAILNPRLFNLINDPPSEMAARNLTLIAKCLQNLSNLVEFGGKEPYMDVVNPFIVKNKERMILFLDHLSNVRERPEPDDQISSDPARDLATLHHICTTHASELQNLSRTRPAVKKLLTVIEMLTKHKQRHLEMLR